MSTLTLSLLGSFQAARDGQRVKSFRTKKVQALLILLAAEPGEQSREKLTTLLWPGMPERSARHNLRQSLFHLRTICRRRRRFRRRTGTLSPGQSPEHRTKPGRPR